MIAPTDHTLTVKSGKLWNGEKIVVVSTLWTEVVGGRVDLPPSLYKQAGERERKNRSGQLRRGQVEFYGVYIAKCGYFRVQNRQYLSIAYR